MSEDESVFYQLGKTSHVIKVEDATTFTNYIIEGEEWLINGNITLKDLEKLCSNYENLSFEKKPYTCLLENEEGCSMHALLIGDNQILTYFYNKGLILGRKELSMEELMHEPLVVIKSIIEKSKNYTVEEKQFTAPVEVFEEPVIEDSPVEEQSIKEYKPSFLRNIEEREKKEEQINKVEKTQFITSKKSEPKPVKEASTLEELGTELSNWIQSTAKPAMSMTVDERKLSSTSQVPEKPKTEEEKTKEEIQKFLDKNRR